MWAQLTYDGVSETYGLPVKRVIVSAQAVTDGVGIQHPGAIFSRWSPAELLAIGWPPFREVGYDQAIYRSLGSADEIAGDEVVRTHTLALANLARLKDRRRGEIIAKRDAVMAGGLDFAGSAFDTDAGTVATVNLIASALLDGETLPAGFTWRDRDGAPVAVTDANFQAFRNALARQFALAHKAGADHLAAIEALADAQAVVDYDATTGWPANPA
jgi:hypothetical protein